MTGPRAGVGGRCRIAAVALLALAVAGCSQASGDDASARADEPETRVLTVLAAASLTEVFTDLATTFEADHPGTTVRLSFASSAQLAAQVTQGAPADVLATASPETMAQVVDAGAVAGEPVVVARNRLAIAVPAGNPAGVRGLADLAREELRIALCAEQAPCGAAALEVLATAGVEARPDTLEEDVKATLTKVTLGEVDAALVYRTDIRAAGDKVEGIEVAEAEVAVNDYPVAVLADAPEAGAARDWVRLVQSKEGVQALVAAGFEQP